MKPKTLSLMELYDKFPDDPTAEKWFVKQFWPDGVRCPFCDSDNIRVRRTRKPQPYRCMAYSCWKDFSVKSNSLMHGSKTGFRKWLFAIYLTTQNKGISSVSLGKMIGVKQQTAWTLLHKIREAYGEKMERFQGPVEVDEAYIGGKEGNKHFDHKIPGGNKVPVVGVRDRGTGKVQIVVVDETGRGTLHSIIGDTVEKNSKIFTDDYAAYKGLDDYMHESIRHSIGEYTRWDAHTNGIESVWAQVKRTYMGTYHWISPKHLHRYMKEFAGRHNLKSYGALEQMEIIAARMKGKTLTYREIVGDTSILGRLGLEKYNSPSGLEY